MARRRQARTAALQLLFQKDLVTDVTTALTEDMLLEMVPDENLRRFAWQLYAGTLDHRSLIDKEIQRVAQNWRVSRMSATDRNVIRMGVYEMTYLKTDAAVVIDECIEIAKEYGTPQSGPFVNGILDKLKPQTAKASQAVQQSSSNVENDEAVNNEASEEESIDETILEASNESVEDSETPVEEPKEVELV